MATTYLNGIDLHYQESGAGEHAILFVHGFPFTSVIWRDQLRALPPGWRGIAPDLRGFGESGLGDLPVHTMDVFALDLVALLDHLRIEKAVVCGLSMGGYIAFALWRLASERVSGLVLADTRASADGEQARRDRRTLAAEVRTEGTSRLIGAMLERLLTPTTLRLRADLVERLRGIMADASAEGIARASLGMGARPDSMVWLATMHVPTLVAVGAQDVITPVHDAELMLEELPEAHLHVVPSAGHVSNFEQPEDFNRALGYFLTEVAGHAIAR